MRQNLLIPLGVLRHSALQVRSLVRQHPFCREINDTTKHPEKTHNCNNQVNVIKGASIVKKSNVWGGGGGGDKCDVHTVNNFSDSTDLFVSQNGK